MAPTRKRKTANEELFALVLKRWQSLPSEREKASFFVDVVLRDERFTDLLPFMVDAALKELGQNEAGRPRAPRSKLSPAKEKSLRETFWLATAEWQKEHPGASGLSDAQSAWRYAVGRAAAKTHADPKTVKRRFPDPVEKARARVRAHVQALREETPKR